MEMDRLPMVRFEDAEYTRTFVDKLKRKLGQCRAVVIFSLAVNTCAYTMFRRRKVRSAPRQRVTYRDS